MVQKILAGLLPARLEYNMYKYEQYSHLLLLVLILTDVINYILNPLFMVAESVISYLVGVII